MRALVLLFAVIALLVPAALADPHDVHGMWLTKDKDSYVEIRDCGDGTPCGFIIGPAPGFPVKQTHDIYNPDPAKHADPLQGMLMLHSFVHKKSGWKSGKIYDPTSGKTYGSRLKRLDADTLQLKGCVGPICQTHIWTLADPEEAYTAASLASGGD